MSMSVKRNRKLRWIEGSEEKKENKIISSALERVSTTKTKKKSQDESLRGLRKSLLMKDSEGPCEDASSCFDYNAELRG